MTAKDSRRLKIMQELENLMDATIRVKRLRDMDVKDAGEDTDSLDYAVLYLDFAAGSLFRASGGMEEQERRAEARKAELAGGRSPKRVREPLLPHLGECVNGDSE